VAHITVGGGRRLSFDVHGDPSGQVVLHTHGTPGSRIGVRPSDAAMAVSGACVITYDRPGYGESDPHPGRRVADAAHDVAAIADSLAVTSFAVYGISGGGPHALACAALLSDRVTRVSSMVGVGPYGVPGLDWMAGMTQSNVEEMTAALAGAAVLTEALESQVGPIRDEPGTLLDTLELELPDSDRQVIHDPRIRAMLIDTFGAGLAPGVQGWVDDDLAFTSPWGFDVAAISVPTLLWHGTQDVLAPVSHTEWLSQQLPHARFVRAPGAGHMAAFVAQDAVLGWLLGDDSAL
jgi:pimeloyl-ACP methyl ester carboxylesterase